MAQIRRTHQGLARKRDEKGMRVVNLPLSTGREEEWAIIE